MRLADDDALVRLAAHDHGILCTLNAERGVDAVPVAFVVDDGHVGVPIDLVKPKTSLRLQRERNLEADPRATLLVEHWDRDDWSRLWWVRAELPAVRGSAVRSRVGPAPGRRDGLGRHRTHWHRWVGASPVRVVRVSWISEGTSTTARWCAGIGADRRSPGR